MLMPRLFLAFLLLALPLACSNGPTTELSTMPLAAPVMDPLSARNDLIRATYARCVTVRDAALSWRRQSPAACPSISQLVADGLLEAPSSGRDAWDRVLTLTCDGSIVWVTSAGPDETFDTADDLSAN